MTNTYTDPSTGSKDEVRFLLGDTKSGEWLLTDEEIAFAITKYAATFGGHMEYVAAFLAEQIASRYGREVSYSADGVSIGLGEVSKQYRELAASLRQQYKDLLIGGYPDVGGITPGEELLPGLKNYAFGTGMHDSPDVGPQDYGAKTDTPYPVEDYPGQ